MIADYRVLCASVLLLGSCMSSTSISKWRPLPNAPKNVSQYKEIAAVFNENLPEYYNALLPQERVMAYYLYKASLPGNRIALDQSHRHAPIITDIFAQLLAHKEALQQSKLSFDVAKFLKQAKLYYIYLITNHGQYFIREHAFSKRTPSYLELDLLSPENIIAALKVLGNDTAETLIAMVHDSLFDKNIEPTRTVPDSISKSAVNFYSSDFTDQDFEQLDPAAQSTLNAYFYIDTKDGKRMPAYQLYSTTGKYAKELSEAVTWLEKAYQLALEHPDTFDEHFAKSLTLMVDYLKSGDEQIFKKHSIEWLQSKSRLDYVFGFIEHYEDPKQYRAIFQSDVTTKSVAIDELNKILPQIEQDLPIAQEFKRKNLHADSGAIPNASINVKIFSAGELGPLNITAAYALPNYEEIRSQEGTKQIIYHADKSIGELINPKLYHRLFNNSRYHDWLLQHDPDHKLMKDILMLEVILHETLGHGSGQLTEHTFVEGEPHVIEGVTYQVGDTIPVTSSNLKQFLAGNDATIEELRAEIIALLASIVSFDELAKAGMLKDWPEKLGKKKLIELQLLNMARTGLRRLIQQPDAQVEEISGDHARANSTILNYLLDSGSVAIETEPVTIDGQTYTIVDVHIINQDEAIKVVEKLANLVQKIKSTGDYLAAKELISTYGSKIRNPEYMQWLKENMKAAAGDVKVTAMIYPEYSPIMDEKGAIIDIQATWSADIID